MREQGHWSFVAQAKAAHAEFRAAVEMYLEACDAHAQAEEEERAAAMAALRALDHHRWTHVRAEEMALRVAPLRCAVEETRRELLSRGLSPSYRDRLMRAS